MDLLSIVHTSVTARSEYTRFQLQERQAETKCHPYHDRSSCADNQPDHVHCAKRTVAQSTVLPSHWHLGLVWTDSMGLLEHCKLPHNLLAFCFVLCCGWQCVAELFCAVRAMPAHVLAKLLPGGSLHMHLLGCALTVQSVVVPATAAILQLYP